MMQQKQSKKMSKRKKRNVHRHAKRVVISYLDTSTNPQTLSTNLHRFTYKSRKLDAYNALKGVGLYDRVFNDKEVFIHGISVI